MQGARVRSWSGRSIGEAECLTHSSAPYAHTQGRTFDHDLL